MNSHRMQITVQMFGTYELKDSVINELSDNVLSQHYATDQYVHLGYVLGSYSGDIDGLKSDLHSFLVRHREIYYIDVMYLQDDIRSFAPQRFVIWRDGRERDYHTRISFEEVD